MKFRETPKDYLLSRIIKIKPPAGEHYSNLKEYCWIWNKSKDRDGYGYCAPSSGHSKAHRLAYATFNGDIPKGLLVTHLCDNPSCVNPSHLKLGTILSNNREIQKRKRGWQHKVTAKEGRRKRSVANKGRYMSPETKKKIGDFHRGKTVSEETRQKISKTKQGSIPWNLGIPHSEETKLKISKANKKEEFHW